MDLFKAEMVGFDSRTQSIIRGASLAIGRGSVTGILGPSGGGKSTLIKILAGILVPTSGRVLFEGRDIRLMSSEENKRFRKRCAFVFQDSALWANQTIEQNLSLPLQTQNPGMEAGERSRLIGKVCDLVGYGRALSLRPVDLSMGEQKRVAFARAFITSPEVLFLDECTESLDAQGAAHIMGIIRDFALGGNTVIYVSHRRAFVEEMMEIGRKTGRGAIFDVDGGVVTGEGNYEI